MFDLRRGTTRYEWKKTDLLDFHTELIYRILAFVSNNDI